MNKYKNIFLELVIVALPAIAEQILSTVFQYVDTAMVGHLGENATAAVSVTTTFGWLVASILSTVGVAALSIIAIALGGEKIEKIKNTSMQISFLVILSGSLLGFVMCFLSPYIPGWMGSEETIIEDASKYFYIISLPMVFKGATIIYGSCLRAIKNTKVPMVINITANVINILLNVVFIYYLGMGVTGAAIATAIATVFSGTAMFIAVIKNEYLSFDIKKLYIDKSILNECFIIGLPVLITNIITRMGYVFFAAIVSGMGTTVFAAHSLAITAEQLFYIPGYGIKLATSALVGIAYGQKDEEKFYMVTKVSIVLTTIIMLISGGILYVAARPLMHIFTGSVPVIDLGGYLLKIVAFSEVFMGLMIVLEGIFYGVGETKYPLWVGIISMWIIRNLSAYVCVKILGLGITSVWICMIADNVFRAIIYGIKIKKGNIVNFEKTESKT